MRTLFILDCLHCFDKLCCLPWVTGAGVVHLGQVPGYAFGVYQSLVEMTLKNAALEGIGFVELEAVFMSKEAFSFFRFDSL